MGPDTPDLITPDVIISHDRPAIGTIPPLLVFVAHTVSYLRSSPCVTSQARVISHEAVPK